MDSEQLRPFATSSEYLIREVGGYLFGSHLGSGIHRNVYTYAPDPEKWVVKVEVLAGSFANVREWELWQAAKDTPYARWFAPLREVSPSGGLLIQARTRPVTAREMPARVPAFFTDLKPENWGRYRGRIVCHDYANNLAIENGLGGRMRRADWR